jgi:N-hydroxyarylamine O-acetyltransferase
VYTGRVDATDYLTRIGAAADDPLDVLMARHLEAVPFENLSIHELGHDVAHCSARVATGNGFSFPGDHMALVVDGHTLVDVGFGRFAVGPLDLHSRDEQPDRAGVFTVRDAPDGELDVDWDGRTQYRLDPRTRSLADFVPMAWWHRTSSTSPFTKALLASRLTPTARVTLSGDLYIETSDDGQRSERTLSVDEQLATYRDVFGLALDAVPAPLHPSD